MPFRFAALLMTLVLALSSSVFAGAKKGKAKISFHMQTEATDNPKMIFAQATNGRTRHFRRMPEITGNDVAAFKPFPSDVGGDDYGLVLKLKETGTKRLFAITNVNQGRWMISQVNGRVVDGLLIDKPVNDGLLVIWKGVTLADITILDETFPRIGEENKR